MFPNGMEPQLMYPERDMFHVSEVLPVYLLAGMYFARKGELEQALQRLEMMEQIDPDCQQCEVLERVIEYAMARDVVERSQQMLLKSKARRSKKTSKK